MRGYLTIANLITYIKNIASETERLAVNHRYIKIVNTLTRSELMQRTAKGELRELAELFLEKLGKFEITYPQIFKNLDESLYSEVDLNLGDLINTVQVFAEILE